MAKSPIHDTPPHSAEAEQGVLGSMLSYPKCIAECALRAGADHFYVPAHQTIFNELLELWHKGTGIDLITFTQILRDRNILETIGGASFITDLHTFVPTAGNVNYYLDIVHEKYVLRQIIAAATEIVRKGYEKQASFDEVTKDTEALLASVANRYFTPSRQREIKAIVEAVMDGFSSPEKILGLSTGYKALDNAIGGLAPGAKIVIAGQISGGKSSLAECIVNNVCVSQGIPTVIFSFEMSENQTVARLIQIRSEVSTGKIARGESELWQLNKYASAAGEVAKSKLYVINERIGLNGIRARIMQLRPRLVCIDYVQILPENRQKGENRTDQLDRISSETKQMANQFGLTLIELSQLTETASGPRTKGSRGITADCDSLLVIEDDKDAKVKDGEAAKNIFVAKNRDGQNGQSLPFRFQCKITKFKET